MRPRAPGTGSASQHAFPRTVLTAMIRNSWWLVPMLLTLVIFVVLVVLIGGEGLSLYLDDPT